MSASQRVPVPDFEAPERILLAAPRGWCAGVERAVDIVEVALATYGAPIYVRKQIVHNLHVVRSLEAKGAVFVEELDEVPSGSTVVFSAHGVSPVVHRQAAERDLKVIDATCPLVTKVHHEARKYSQAGYDIVLIGHEGHEEVVGTMGHASRNDTGEHTGEHTRVHLVGDADEARQVQLDDPAKVAYLTQTTLSVDETEGVVDVLRQRFPVLAGPKADDICYATQNRQVAVKQLAAACDLVLVIGATNSSNSVRLVEVARAAGTASHLIADASMIDPAWFDGVRTLGLTSGASAPEWLIEQLVATLRERGTAEVTELRAVEEDVHFALPGALRRDAEAAQADASRAVQAQT
jgi:4-hydroxy-3-methylbut-2-enyl diphosphate reductase